MNENQIEKAALALSDLAVALDCGWDEILADITGSCVDEEDAGRIEEWLEQPR